MQFRLVSWNINSVRLRIPQVAQFLKDRQPDLICLQEIKCQTHEFPAEAFAELGYTHLHVSGQKGWHGVAIAGRAPFEIKDTPDFCKRGEARAQAIRIHGFDLWNFYIPAGGDVPDREENPKFDHKMVFYERLIETLHNRPKDQPLLMCGDFNIAPGENDVWSHRQMLKVVSHTPPELDIFGRLVEAGQLHDPFREAIPEPAKLYSWWSYRAQDFRKSGRGLRLDHVLMNPGMMGRVTNPVDVHIHEDCRGWVQPSDHAPIEVTFTV